MDALSDGVRALTLSIATNAVPVIVAQLARECEAVPLDFGLILSDGERLFGSHKTWRGLISGMLACMAAGALFNLPLRVGAGFAATSLLADAAAFILLDLGSTPLRHRRWPR